MMNTLTILIFLSLLTFSMSKEKRLTHKTGVSWQALVSNHDKSVDTEKQFEPVVLGYVTPCMYCSKHCDVIRRNLKPIHITLYVGNNRGYDYAKKYRSKLDLIAPVWLQVTPERDEQSGYVIGGMHDIDDGWIADLKEDNDDQLIPKVVPRFFFDGWTAEDFIHLFKHEDLVYTLSDTLVNICKQRIFDGLVIDTGALGIRHFGNELKVFLRDLSKKLHENNMLLVYVIPPLRGSTPIFKADDFLALAAAVDYFSLMTYDYSNVHSPGPNAPLGFATAAIMSLLSPEKRGINDLKHKILMGINFYGNDYGPPQSRSGNTVLSHDVVKLLKTHKPKITWSRTHHEHYFQYKDTHGSTRTVWYPTPRSIQDRVLVAERLGVGISIWELGQGMESFFGQF